MTGGIDLKMSYLNVSSGSGSAITEVQPTDIYKYQLERLPFVANNAGIIYTLAATGATNSNQGIGGIEWEEIT
jgi:hypothetical protein